MNIYRLLNDNYEINNGEYTINYEAIQSDVLSEEDKDILLLVQMIILNYLHMRSEVFYYLIFQNVISVC